MHLKHTTSREDEFLAKPEEYPNEIADIAKRLDDLLIATNDDFDRVEKENEELQAKIETLEERIAELEADLEEAARGEG